MRIPRSNELDFLRLILATSVVFQHASLAGVNTYMPWVERIPAVPVFILLSGLLVTESYQNSPLLIIYIKKRLRRILPGYIAVVLLGGVILWTIGAILSLPGAGSPKELAYYYFYNLSFLNFLHPCVFDSSVFNSSTFSEGMYCAVNGSLWTIKYELFFYLILPCILFFLNRLSRLICFYASLLLLVITIFPSTIYFQIFICFLAGALLSVSKECWLPRLVKIKIPSILRVFLVLISGILIGGNLPLPFAAITLISFSFLGTKNISRDLNFIKYGDLSYGIYLVHFPLIQIFIFLGIAPLIPELLFSPMITALSGIFAILLYQHVERRFLLRSSYYNQQPR